MSCVKYSFLDLRDNKAETVYETVLNYKLKNKNLISSRGEMLNLRLRISGFLRVCKWDIGVSKREFIGHQKLTNNLSLLC